MTLTKHFFDSLSPSTREELNGHLLEGAKQ